MNANVQLLRTQDYGFSLRVWTGSTARHVGRKHGRGQRGAEEHGHRITKRRGINHGNTHKRNPGTLESWNQERYSLRSAVTASTRIARRAGT